MAGPELRAKRKQVHDVFDRLWIRKRIGRRAGHRADAYRWLAAQLGLTEDECHIGRFDMETCERAIEACLLKKGFKL